MDQLSGVARMCLKQRGGCCILAFQTEQLSWQPFPERLYGFNMKKKSASTMRESLVSGQEKQREAEEALSKKEGILRRGGRWILSHLSDKREDEYRIALKFLEDCKNMLDVGCGTGTFLSKRPGAISGVDINPENVEYCRRQGLRAAEGDALALEFEDQVFDGVHCSHLMHVFLPDQAAQLIKELARVTRKGGKIVITTQNWFSRFYRHPENVRPYPPDAIWRYYDTRQGAASPMYHGLPRLRQQGIRLRRPPLVELYSSTHQTLDQISTVLNAIQYTFYLRKFWSYDAYTVLFRRE